METPPDTSQSRFPTVRWIGRTLFSRKMAIAVIVLVTLVALFYAEENFRGKRAWDRYREESEARGIKLDFAAHIPPLIPDSENGANTPLIQSWFPKPKPDDTNQWPATYNFASSKITVKRRTTGPGSQDDRFFTDLVAWQQAFARLKEPENKDAKKIERNSHATDLDKQEQAAAALAVLAELKAYESPLDELQAMSAHSKVRYPVTYKLDEPFSILIPHLAKLKGIIQVLNLRACAELAAGQTNQAFETVKLMLWICDSVEPEPFLISQLVRIATRQITLQPVWEGLARHQWSEPQLKELQERFLRTDFIGSLDRCLASEQAGGLATIQWMQKQRHRGEAMAMFDWAESESGSPGRSAANKSLGNVIGWFIPNGWFEFEMANYGQLMGQLNRGSWEVEAKAVHPRVVDENNHRLETQLQRGPVDTLWHHYVFSRLLLPALGRASMRSSRAQSTAQQAGLACALERYFLAQGKYPDALTDLLPKYLAKVPHEVVSTNAMHYQQTAQGFLLYSIGWDGKDDGGMFLKPINGRPEIINPENGDWVWRSAP